MEQARKVAIITGAARGLGRACALRLAKDGCDIVVHYNTRAVQAEETAQGVRALGGRAMCVQADLADADAIRNLYAQTLERFNRLDMLVANAAAPLFKPTLTVTDAELRAIVDANVIGTFVLLREAARHIADNGRIIHISTAGTKHPTSAEGLFAGVRAAGDQFALCLAHELGARNVTVNVVSPGGMNTEGFFDILEQAKALFADLTGGAAPPQPGVGDDPRAALSPLRRVAQPEDVADIIAMLVSDDGRWITAQNIFATGGA